MSDAQLGLLSARITELESRCGKLEAGNKLLAAIAKGVVRPSRIAAVEAKLGALQQGVLDLFKSDEDLSRVSRTVTNAISADVDTLREAIVNQAGNVAAITVAMVDKEIVTQEEMTKWMAKTSVWMDQEVARRRDEYMESGEEEKKVRETFEEAGIPDEDIEGLMDEWRQERMGMGSHGSAPDPDGSGHQSMGDHGNTPRTQTGGDSPAE